MQHKRQKRRESNVPFERTSVSVQGLDAARRDSTLKDYLAASNVRIGSLGSTLLQGELSRFRELAFGRATLPESTIVWPRDHLSLDRGIIVVSLSGALEVESKGTVFRKPPGLFLIPPGQQEVVFRSSAQRNELLYVSMSARLLEDIDLSGTQYDPSARVPDGVLAPFVSFIKTVATISAKDTTAMVAPLEAAAAQVARSLGILIADGVPAGLSLFSRTMRLIARDYRRRHLKLATLAEELGVSQRTLQAAFSAEGTSVMREVRAIRARAAHERLRTKPKTTSAHLASSVGFGSTSSLIRAMREFAAHPPADDDEHPSALAPR